MFIDFIKKCSLFSSKCVHCFWCFLWSRWKSVHGFSLWNDENVQESFIVFLQHSSKKIINYEKNTPHFLMQAPPILLLCNSTCWNNCRKFRKVICCSSVNSREFFYVLSSLQRSKCNITPLLNVYRYRGEGGILSVAMLHDSRRTPMSWLSYTIQLCETSYSYTLEWDT